MRNFVALLYFTINYLQSIQKVAVFIKTHTG